MGGRVPSGACWKVNIERGTSEERQGKNLDNSAQKWNKKNPKQNPKGGKLMELVLFV